MNKTLLNLERKGTGLFMILRVLLHYYGCAIWECNVPQSQVMVLIDFKYIEIFFRSH